MVNVDSQAKLVFDVFGAVGDLLADRVLPVSTLLCGTAPLMTTFGVADFLSVTGDIFIRLEGMLLSKLAFSCFMRS